MKPLKPAIYRSIPFILLFSVVLPALATAALGIIMLAWWRLKVDTTVGVLTIVFAALTLSGTLTSFFLLRRQNRLIAMQTEFIANVSHELRTPLSSIRLYLETLQMGRFQSDRDRRVCLDAMEKETLRLIELVENLLGFRNVSRTKEVYKEKWAPVELIQEMLTPFQKLYPSQFCVEVISEVEVPMLWLDRGAFEQAFTNLVQNALTHGRGRERSITVTIQSDNDEVIIAVSDNGPGIPQKELKKIFRRFYRGRWQEAGKAPGLGLGLAIVKTFAKKHSGRVTVTSSVGKGSVFTLFLPIILPKDNKYK